MTTFKQFLETLGDYNHHKAVAARLPRKTTTVGELKKALVDSTLSQRDEQAILDELDGFADDKILRVFDLEQLSAITNVDLYELKALVGLV